MRLSANFTLEEMERSGTAVKWGIDNTAPDDAVTALRALCTHILQPLRYSYGEPITVNSGYRCPRLNAIVGGVPTSQHTKGEAADIDAGSIAENRKLFDILRGFDFDQLIWERGGAWIHVSYRADGRNRHQVLNL